ncbi:MAG: glycosyltransferase [Anaeromyxobacteraceae bacterium]|nr:glycosyltransferase [Anaeromyxobacteraceae bacterium]
MSGVFYRTQVAALTRLGIQVEVLAPVPWVPPSFGCLPRRWRQYRDVPLSQEVDGATIRRPRVLTHPRNLTLGFAHHAHARKVRNHGRAFRPDLIHAHFAYPSGLAAVMAGEDLGTPVVLTLHGSDVNWLPTLNGATKKRVSRAIAGADVVVAVSEALASRAEALAKRRPVVLPIGIELGRFGPGAGKAAARDRLGWDTEEFIALFVGALTQQKGVPELVCAFDHLEPGCRLVLVGDGPLRPWCERSSRAVCYGRRPPSDVPLYMVAADVLVLPSHSEGMPTVLIEAGATGLPVLATPVGGIPELLAQGRGHLLGQAPSSSSAIAGALTCLRGDRKALANSGQALHAFVMDNYDAAACASQLVSRYEEVLVGWSQRGQVTHA